MFPNLSGFKKKAKPPMIDSHVVADGRQIPGTFSNHGSDKILGNPAQTEAAKHHCGSVLNVENRRVGVWKNLVHATRQDTKDVSSFKFQVSAKPENYVQNSD
jgi:hypothetical protein